MKIGIDIRSLTSPTGRGVSHYTLALVAAMAERFPRNRFELLQTGRHPFQLPDELNRPNVRLHHHRHSNKLLNARMALTGRPRMDALLPPVDACFAPNLGFVKVAPGMPLVVTVHDLSFELFPEQYSRQERSWHRLVNPRRLLDRADRVIAVSGQTGRELTDLYRLPKEKIRVVHSGIEPAYRLGRRDAVMAAARAKRKYQLPDSYFLFVGAHDPRKRLAVLLRAYQQAKRQGLAAGLVLVGSVSPELIRLVRQSGEPDVMVLGYVPEADKPGLYAGALAVTLLSLHEGFGFPPLEAAAVGVPSLVSDLAVFTETLGEAKVSVPVDDPTRTARNLVHLEQAADARTKLGQSAKRQVRRLTWDRAATETMQVLTDTIHAK